MTGQKRRLIGCVVLLSAVWSTDFRLPPGGSLDASAPPVSPLQGWLDPAPRKTPERPVQSILGPGSEQKLWLEEGSVHRYGFDLQAGQLLHAEVIQDGVDLAVSLTEPDGKKIFVIDSPANGEGSEEILLFADSPGRYWADLAGAPAGWYKIRVKSIRTASAADLVNTKAEKLFYDAREIRDLDPARAFQGFLAAEALWRQIGNKLRRANAFERMGIILSTKPPLDLERALRFNSLAQELYRAAGDRPSEIRMLIAVGVTQKQKSDISLAEKSYKEARLMAEEEGLDELIATVLLNLGNLYRERGEYWEALSLAEDSLALWRKQGRRDNEVITLNVLSLIYSSLGKYQTAMFYLKQAEEILEPTGSPSLRAQTLMRVSDLYERIGDLDLALAYAKRSLTFRLLASDKRGMAVTLTGIGAIYQKSNLFKEARRAQAQALGIFRGIPDASGEATALVNLGHLQVTSDPAEAIRYFEAGALIARQQEIKELELLALHGMALAERERRNPIAAIRRATESLALIESLSDNLPTDEPKTSFAGTAQDSHKLLIDLLIKSPAPYTPKEDMAEAFEISERRRQSGWLRSLARSEIWEGSLQRADPALLEQRRELEEMINQADREWHRRELAGLPSDSLSQVIGALIERRQTVDALIDRSNPWASTKESLHPISLQEVQRMLDEETILLQYDLGELRSFLWRVTSTSIDVYELPGRSEIEKAARSFHGWLAKGPFKSSQRRAVYEVKHLSQMLLGPVSGHLNAKRIVIVPDGALCYVPFSVLTEPGGTARWNSPWPPPLLLEHEVLSIPSISALRAIRFGISRRTPHDKVLAVLAAPFFTDKGLQSLPFAEKEAGKILSLVPREQRLEALREKATRHLVRSGALKGVRLIHLATHAINHSEHPELDSIMLSQVNGHGWPIEGRLRMQEIRRLYLTADLVVLSACKTSLSDKTKGEGIVGLGQAFLYSGAARVVSSLWNVNDESTSAFMEKFYHAHLVGKQSPAAALRTAQLWMAQETEWSSPYHWGAFQIQGEWQ